MDVSEQNLLVSLSEVCARDTTTAVSSVGDPLNDATAAELRVLGQVVDKRKQEYVAGRNAARCALRGLGFPPGDILVGAHRQPLPPLGSSISITHDSEYAFAVAGLNTHWYGLGVDVTQADELAESLISTVCRGSDLLDLAPSETLSQRAKLVFCLKEALFKAVFPQVIDWMEFSQSELQINHEIGGFEARILNPNDEPLELDGRWVGRFLKVGNRWLAFAGLRRE